jgi:hypothetical protein
MEAKYILLASLGLIASLGGDGNIRHTGEATRGTEQCTMSTRPSETNVSN